ncbi:MAG: S1C family serine protease, partial [Vicinamibacteria bacterium]
VEDIRESDQGYFAKFTRGVSLAANGALGSVVVAWDYAWQVANLRFDASRRFEGTGFIASSEGHVVTNNHVVSGVREVKIRLRDKSEFAARVVNRDPTADIALLSITGTSDKPWPAIRFGDSDETEAGEFVLAMGNPLGLEQTVTTGVVSNSRRAGARNYYIQTDAAINQGNSGGPLFNSNGEVIGMNTMMVANAENIGFAVPSNSIVAVFENLKKPGPEIERGSVGIQLRHNSPYLREEHAIAREGGFVVTAVEKGSEAEKKGLRVGDVVTEMNGAPFVDKTEFLRAEAVGGIGRSIRFGVERGDVHHDIELIVAKLGRRIPDDLEDH